MAEQPTSPRLIRPGAYEFDSYTLELRKNGHKLKLAGQPIEALAIMLERPGELITREALQKRHWTNDTIVEFEHSINAAIKRVREALARRGYRFIAPVEGLTPSVFACSS